MIVIQQARFPSTQDGTFGVLFDQNKVGDWIPFSLSLERKRLNNEKGKSCIPANEYLCKRVNVPLHGNTFEITGVPGRDAILFHKGNIDDDSHGCVIIGEMFDPIWDKTWQGWSPGVAASGKGYQEFMDKLKGVDEFKYVIKSMSL